MRFLLALAGAAAVAVVPIRTAAQQRTGLPESAAAPAPTTVTTKVNCAAKTRSFKTNDFSADSTTSTVFVGIPGTDVPFTIGGTSLKNCIVVTFSAYTFAADLGGANQLMMVQAYLDGAPMQPGEVQFSGDDDQNANFRWARTHSYTWTAYPVAFGNHVVQMAYRSFFGGTVFVHRRSTVVLSK
jgi:hypothetical protein